MSRIFPPDSVGLVTPQKIKISEPLKLACGQVLESHELVYETYGELNETRTNAILICHALSGDHHAAGYHTEKETEKPGWWDNYIGPGKALDTNRFHVVVPNNIGGCSGSTGPNTINPETGKYWGPDFPPLRFRDWMESQKMLGDALGIDCWAAIVGASVGGMQAMRWATIYPDKVKHAVIIASALKLTPTNIAFNEIARKAIKSDPNFHMGHYLDKGTVPDLGLALARMLAHITYLSDYDLEARFGRDLKSGSFAGGDEDQLQFEIESYLNYKGDQFVNRFDANTYLLITRMLDVFDLARDYGNDPIEAFKQATCKFLVFSFSTDWRFPPLRSQEIVNAMIAANKEVSYLEVEANKGHDSFLLPVKRYEEAFKSYMQGVARDL